MYVPRLLEVAVTRATIDSPVVMVTGPRQSGKTTMLRAISTPDRRFVTLDDLDIRRFAQREPGLFIRQFPPPVLIDEFQYAPDILPYIKIAVDELTTRGKNREAAGMYWLTGSQQFVQMKGVRESLAGRVALLDLLGFSPYELLQPVDPRPEGFFEQDPATLADDDSLAAGEPDPLEVFATIIRGSLPRAALGDRSPSAARAFYSAYVQTYLERDVSTLDGVRNLGAFETFLRLLAARAGQLVNFSQLAREAGVSVNAIRQWTAILEKSYHVCLLQPYYRSLSKRLVKTPKVYFLDSGLHAYLTGWSEPEQASHGPLAGQLFENWVVSTLVKSYRHRGLRENLFFWRTRTGQELDLWSEAAGVITAAEVKLSARNDDRAFGLLDGIDPSPFRFGRRLLLTLSRNLLEYAPGTWNIPIRYIN
jgi:predicted AAA+ superfamily ATPase